MSTPGHANRMLFLNLPVADLEASKAFFAKLGFSYKPKSTGETAACMLIGEQALCMLLGPERFTQLSRLPIADPTTHALAHYCFSMGRRDEVDSVADAALAAGGTNAGEPEDYGFMRSRSFHDLDGHFWDVMWMDPIAAEQGPEEQQQASTPA